MRNYFGLGTGIWLGTAEREDAHLPVRAPGLDTQLWLQLPNARPRGSSGGPYHPPTSETWTEFLALAQHHCRLFGINQQMGVGGHSFSQINEYIKNSREIRKSAPGPGEFTGELYHTLKVYQSVIEDTCKGSIS